MIRVMQIILQPVLFLPDKEDVLFSLEKVISEEFTASSIVRASPIKEIPVELFDKQRKQWKSNDILQWLSNIFKPSSKSSRLLAICDFDADSNALNFVFGEAYVMVVYQQYDVATFWITHARIYRFYYFYMFQTWQV